MSRRQDMNGSGGAAAAALNATIPYKWTWANATARQAQSVVTADVGKVGYQSDTKLEHKLIATAGSAASGPIWGPQDDPSMGPTRSVLALPGVTGGTFQSGMSWQLNTGTQTQRTIANTNKFTRLARNAGVSAASLGAFAVYQNSSNITVWMASLGLRRRYIVGPSGVSANMAWSAGLTSDFISTNIDPTVLLNCFMIGISGAGDTNLQLMYNDGAGAAQKVDLGASFNAPRTANEGYIFDIYTLDGTDWAYQVERVNTGVAVSGTILSASGVPSPTAGLYDHAYVSNRADSTSVAIDVSSVESWQRFY